MRETNLPIVQAEMRVLYGVDENGKQVVSTTYVADGVDDSIPDYFTGIVMLETAKIDFLQRHGVICSCEHHD